MSFPTVTITVNSAVPEADAETAEASLHMMYVQAVLGDMRHQWVVFPPALKALGVPEDKIPPGAQCLTLHRIQEFEGNRSKWFHYRGNVGQGNVPAQITGFGTEGWAIGGIVVVPLDKDDYLSAWAGNTPHKAMRAVARALEPLGISVK